MNLAISYLDQDPLPPNPGDTIFFGHREELKDHTQYNYVPPCHKPEKNLFAASAFVCEFLKALPGSKELEVMGRPEVLYYCIYQKGDLAIQTFKILPGNLALSNGSLVTKLMQEEARHFVLNTLDQPPPLPIQRKFALSICMTTFNRSLELADSLRSLDQQTDKNFELIVINDGSSDPTSLDFHTEVKKSYFQKNKNWKWIDQENSFLGEARNNAAKAASGNVLLFLDDDNIPQKKMIETYKRYWENFPNRVFVSSFEIFYEAHPGILNRWYPFTNPRFSHCLGNIIADAQCLIDKELFNQIQGYTTDRGLGFEDWELYNKLLLQNEPIYPILDPLYLYRVNSANNSMRKYTKGFQNNERATRPFVQRLPRLKRSVMFNISLFNSNNYLFDKRQKK